MASFDYEHRFTEHEQEHDRLSAPALHLRARAQHRGARARNRQPHRNLLISSKTHFDPIVEAFAAFNPLTCGV